MIREDNDQRGDCRIEIGNQKTRMDTTIPEPGIRPHEPPRRQLYVTKMRPLVKLGHYVTLTPAWHVCAIGKCLLHE